VVKYHLDGGEEYYPVVRTLDGGEEVLLDGGEEVPLGGGEEDSMVARKYHSMVASTTRWWRGSTTRWWRGSTTRWWRGSTTRANEWRYTPVLSYHLMVLEALTCGEEVSPMMARKYCLREKVLLGG